MGLAFKLVTSPVGELKLVTSSAGLTAVLWPDDGPRRVALDEPTLDPAHPLLLETERQLAEYFAGVRTMFTVALDLRGTEFQKRVWEALQGIPAGETRSYGQLASQLGCPKAVRAVGAANARNPVFIIVPCHRVIGASGKLTGFAGGLEIKAHLLDFEQRLAKPRLSFDVGESGNYNPVSHGRSA